MERKRISTTELRKQNRNQVFRIIYDAEGPLTKQEIAKRLHMSLPTVTQNLKELFDENILTDAGADESTGGRKARLITLNKNVYFSVGIELSPKHIRFIAINLKAEELAYEKLEYPFSNTPEYRMVYAKKLEEFLDRSLAAAGAGAFRNRTELHHQQRLCGALYHCSETGMEICG